MTIAGLCTASFSTLALVFALGHSGQSHGTVLDVFRRTFSTDLRALNRAEVARLSPPPIQMLNISIHSHRRLG